jgi:hypothetical protein
MNRTLLQIPALPVHYEEARRSHGSWNEVIIRGRVILMTECLE